MTIPTKHFYMIRHGESEANAQQRLAGWEWDTHLTEKGRMQAQAVQRFIGKLERKPRSVIHSHLSRARETATILNEALNLQMTLVEDIGEQKFGDWQGAPWTETRPKIHQGINPPGGETHEEFSRRVHRGIKSALDHAAPPLIVCHGGVFIGFYRPFNVTLPRVENCTLYEFEPHGTDRPFPWTVYFYTENGVRERIEIEMKSYYAASD